MNGSSASKTARSIGEKLGAKAHKRLKVKAKYSEKINYGKY